MSSSSIRLKRSLLLRDSILSKAKASPDERLPKINISDEDYLFMHILDCIGALSCIRADQQAKNINEPSNSLIISKHRVFWLAVREIAEREAVLMEAKFSLSAVPNNVPFEFVLNCFPDDSKQYDGRSWLPLHFAVSLPTANIADVETLYSANSAAITACTDPINKMNPCHLAAMINNPRLDVIKQLQIYYPPLGLSLAYHSNTPLHLAVMHSSSAGMVRELARFYPTALEMRNNTSETPLSVVTSSMPKAALEKLKVLIEEAPHTARMLNPDDGHSLPLHQLLSHDDPPDLVNMIAMLIETFHDSVNIPDGNGWLAIHHATWSSTCEAMKVIAEANMMNLHARAPGFGTVAHLVIRVCCMDKLKYIHTTLPQLLYAVCPTRGTILHEMTNINDAEMRITTSPLSAGSDILRYLLRHCPGLVDIKNSTDKTLYDLLPDSFVYIRRLLLMAESPPLHPQVLKELNYAERRVAMLVFFSSATKTQSVGIFSRIRLAPGAPELIRTIVGFL
eukprot:gene24446-32895_t